MNRYFLEVIEMAEGAFAYCFEGPDEYVTWCYLLVGKKCAYLVDTFMGSDAVTMILRHAQQSIMGKRLIIINTHHDFDHYFGNGAVPGAIIISHQKTPALIRSQHEKNMVDYASQLWGTVTLQLPTVLFNQRLLLVEDDITLFFTPGHTEDGISLWDARRKILLVGDMLEQPHPFVEETLRTEYYKSLDKYEELPAVWIGAGHTLTQERRIILENRSYLQSLY